MEYSLGQLGSAALDMSPPKFLLTPSQQTSATIKKSHNNIMYCSYIMTCIKRKTMDTLINIWLHGSCTEAEHLWTDAFCISHISLFITT